MRESRIRMALDQSLEAQSLAKSTRSEEETGGTMVDGEPDVHGSVVRSSGRKLGLEMQ